MQQLLQIENVPIKLEIKSTMARFERSEEPDIPADSLTSPVSASSSASVASSSASAAQVSYPAKDEYVTSDRSSYSSMLSMVYAGMDGSSTQASAVTSDYIKAGVQNIQMQAQASSQVSHSEYVDKQMEVYSSDRSNFEISSSLGLNGMEFVPGSIEFTVTQKPAVNFEYVGSPIYVPKSADPNYVDVYA